MYYTDSIDSLSRLIRQYKKDKLRKSGVNLTVEQWTILEQLKSTPGITQIALSEFVDKDPAAVMRTLNLLELRGLAQRTNPPGNLRNHSLFLTDSGRAMLHKLWPVSIDIRAEGNRGIDARELEEFIRILEKMRQNFVPKK